MDYRELNAKLNLFDSCGKMDLEVDKYAVKQYFLRHVNNNTVFFHDLKEKLDYLVDECYYEPSFLQQYTFETIKLIYNRAYSYKFRFQSFLGAYKFYTNYALKSQDGTRYLERYEDRVAAVALYLAKGNVAFAEELVDEIMTGRFQPATPTFINCGRKQRGELVSCFLLRVEDTMESVCRAITSSLQLSKRGGGVALCLSNIRETGAPIKGMQGQASGVLPIMKILEDSFSYANQLGSRQGAGAVYLHAHHMDILQFLDTKRENADEKVRIKTLSLGVVIPDITFELARDDDDMYLFSTYDIEQITGRGLADTDVTADYTYLMENPAIRKTKIKARKFFQLLAEVQFESGYPYILFEGNANRHNPIEGRINMSNLCTEILQVNEETLYKSDLSIVDVGQDISCNLGSLNIAKVMDGGDLRKSVSTAIYALTAVAQSSDISCVPSIKNGNDKSRAIGLGQMNLHGFLAREGIEYGSPEAIEFVSVYFAAVLYYALEASCQIAVRTGEGFEGFEGSKYATGEFFVKYIEQDWLPKTAVVKSLFKKFDIRLPSRADWKQLCGDVMRCGLYNRNLLAVAPTGSISYINNSTASIHPIAARIEVRKEGKLGRVYYPAPHLNNDNKHLFKDAYEIGYEKIIDTYAAAQEHVDQGLSLTLFLPDTATTRDLNKAQIYAWKKGIKTLYYVRVRQKPLEGTRVEECVSCSL